MQKRGWTGRLTLLGLATMLFLPAVSAQSPFSSVGGMIQRFLSPILLTWDMGAGFWSKALLWILIFTLFYAVMGVIPLLKEKSKNIRLTLSLVLALIATLPLKAPLIRALFETYGIIVASVLIFVPIFGLLWLNSKLLAGLKESNPRLAHAISAILYYILAAVIQNVVIGVQAQAFSTSAQLGEVGNFAVGVCGLLFIYHVIMMLFGGPEDTPHRQVSEAAGGLWDFMRDTLRPEHPAPAAPGTPPPDTSALTAHIDQLCASMTQFHNMVMHRAGYRYIGNLLLEAEYRAFRRGDAAMLAQIPQRRQNFRDAAAQAQGLRDAIQASTSRLVNDANFGLLRRADHRRFQRCMRRWTVAYLSYQEYNIRFLVNYPRIAGPVRF